MAGRNDVPESVSQPIPGFEEARTAWLSANADWLRRRAARGGEIAADRGEWRRKRIFELNEAANAQLMKDINPLRVAADYTTGDLALNGLGIVGKAAVSAKMRPGHIVFPTRGGKATFDVSRVPVPRVGGSSYGSGGVSLNQAMTDALHASRLLVENTVDWRTGVRTGGSLYFGMTGEESSLVNPGKIVRYADGGMNATALGRIRSYAPPIPPAEGRYVGMFPPVGRPAGPGPSRVVSAYDAHAQTIRNLYKSQEAAKALRNAMRTGDRSSPFVKLYDEAREGMAKTRLMLDSYQAKTVAKQNRDALAKALSGVKSEVEMAKSLRATPAKPPKAGAGELFPKVVLPWLKDKATHPFSTASSLALSPFRHPVKVGLPLGILGYAGAKARLAARDSDLAAGTASVTASKEELENGYSAYTSDEAVRLAMSDENALRASLLGIRKQALAELSAHKDRIFPVKTRLQGFIDSVKDSQAFSDLVLKAETEYAARALRPDDYRKEFRETYRNPESQALGEDFWREIREIGGEP